MTPNKQATTSYNNKNTCIDLYLPNPKTPITINVDAGYTEEVSGGMDWGCQEIATNVQDGPTKGGILPHVYA